IGLETQRNLKLGNRVASPALRVQHPTQRIVRIGTAWRSLHGFFKRGTSSREIPGLQGLHSLAVYRVGSRGRILSRHRERQTAETGPEPKKQRETETVRDSHTSTSLQRSEPARQVGQIASRAVHLV